MEALYFLNKKGIEKAKLNSLLSRIEKFIPAKVIEYDKETNRAKCQIMIYTETTDNKVIPPAPVSDIPVFNYGGSDFSFKIKIKTDDLGYLLACDNDISKFKENHLGAPPVYNMRHRYFNSIFLPAGMYNIDNDDNIYIGNKLSSSYLSINEEDLKMKSKVINIDASENVNILINNEPAISISGGNIDIHKDINFKGKIKINGVEGATGTFTDTPSGRTINIQNGVITAIV